MSNLEFPYDAFISYRQQEPDKSWVRDRLVPALSERGVRVFIDFRDFRLGRPLVTEMARAVEQSRYTVAVLSNAYLQSHFTELENILAKHLGLEQGETRLLIVDREPVVPPLGMRAVLRLDFSTDAAFDEGLPRLATALRGNA
jgi:hypothetical protein